MEGYDRFKKGQFRKGTSLPPSKRKGGGLLSGCKLELPPSQPPSKLMNSGQGVPFPVAKPPGLPVAPRPAAGSTLFFQENCGGAKEAKVPPSSSPSLEAALQAARRVSKAQGQAGNSVAPFAIQQQPSVAAGASEFVETLVSKAPAGWCMHVGCGGSKLGPHSADDQSSPSECSGQA